LRLERAIGANARVVSRRNMLAAKCLGNTNRLSVERGISALAAAPMLPLLHRSKKREIFG